MWQVAFYNQKGQQNCSFQALFRQKVVLLISISLQHNISPPQKKGWSVCYHCSHSLLNLKEAAIWNLFQYLTPVTLLLNSDLQRALTMLPSLFNVNQRKQPAKISTVMQYIILCYKHYVLLIHCLLYKKRRWKSKYIFGTPPGCSSTTNVILPGVFHLKQKIDFQWNSPDSHGNKMLDGGFGPISAKEEKNY